ncbi:GNAT family N-acetyltransferase [Flammeovirga kamogawensis]|uniref:GNAT family N-acetyltransferase n=1 Tax=Flammeovirga kamogawensis TaxID=373891 RepID=A0ABX8H1F2_9BACT|nr:GNAT family protein [Flammeovirga kamogawensis]MBB6462192.1 RimJ/RimL family protein N-acetyltransferase [Flammeovirga kamogawensis]QWG09407.1 GNAT family N-acetyltransferase [Flammeovirga kamogawensis]TRX64925.1 GNAT family N-acetyltransferase [Flammeovirga kamogawensis]
MNLVNVKKVTLRKLEFSDCSRMMDLVNNKNITKNLLDRFPIPFTFKHAHRFIENAKTTKLATVFGIEYKGEYVGNIELMHGQDVYRKGATLGYFIGEEYWNRGIASAAVKMMIDYSFKYLDFIKINALVFDKNIASQKVLEKSGFKVEGILRKAVYKNDEYLNEIHYAIFLDNYS